MVVEREAKRLLSVSGTGVKKRGVIVRAIKRTKKTIYGAFPSAPGEPPHKQTGRLRMSVTHEVLLWGLGRLIARVGTNVPYGKFLQLGTRFVKPRPWLDVAMDRTLATVGKILSAPWNWPG